MVRHMPACPYLAVRSVRYVMAALREYEHIRISAMRHVQSEQSTYQGNPPSPHLIPPPVYCGTRPGVSYGSRLLNAALRVKEGPTRGVQANRARPPDLAPAPDSETERLPA